MKTFLGRVNTSHEAIKNQGNIDTFSKLEKVPGYRLEMEWPPILGLKP